MANDFAANAMLCYLLWPTWAEENFTCEHSLRPAAMARIGGSFAIRQSDADEREMEEVQMMMGQDGGERESRERQRMVVAAAHV